MARRKYLVQEYKPDRGRVAISTISFRPKPKDNALMTRAKVCKVFIYCIIISSSVLLLIISF
jgi:hypothetical protein